MAFIEGGSVAQINTSPSTQVSHGRSPSIKFAKGSQPQQAPQTTPEPTPQTTQVNLGQPKQSTMPLSTAASSFVDVEVSNIRKVIAERLVLSKNTIPHFYVNVECNMDKVIK